MFAAPIFAVLFGIFGLSVSSYAFVSLQAGSMPFYWANSTVTFTINETADPGTSDESDVAAVRLAFEAWSKVPSSRIDFVEDTNSGSRARTDWRSDDLHVVLWDTTNESGFFGPGSGLVAITPVDFDPSSGRILDADILFNGTKPFSTSGDAGKFDIQNIATHEVGHFIGLDHSGVIGATMNPFANTTDTRLRSLEADDIAAAGAIYPIGAEPGSIQGYVRIGGKAVSGAHVVAEDMNGVAASAGLSDGNGFFKIRGLDQGSYAVYAEPLDGPVTNANFSLHTSGLTIDTNFGTTFWGAGGSSSPRNPERVTVSFAQSTDVGQIDALASNGMNLTSISRTTVMPNSEFTLSVYGTNLDRADSILVPGPPGDPLFVADEAFSRSSARMTLSIGPSALSQLRSVRVFNDATQACVVLTGGFEIRAAPPTLTGLDPAEGESGTVVTLSGANFEPGARVIFGGFVIQASGMGNSVSFTVPNGAGGVYSVAVENPDGQFVKIRDGFTLAGPVATPGTDPDPITQTNSLATPNAPSGSAAAGAAAPKQKAASERE
ncbi:MAG: matrixin family metalloprotease [Planctomycetes bacterium]|nr:matrixin family metalloprotease [Planctomycetota bacterium]